MSRMASSGTRTRSRSVRPSGFRNAWTVTSFGMSCAETRATTDSATAALATTTDTKDTKHWYLGRGDRRAGPRIGPAFCVRGFLRVVSVSNTVRIVYLRRSGRVRREAQPYEADAQRVRRVFPAPPAARARHRPGRARSRGAGAIEGRGAGAAVRS